MNTLKADWPCTKGKEIDSAYFEDLRKILWGFNKLGYGIDQGVAMKEADGEWIYSFWNPKNAYHANKCCGTITRFSTVIYYDKNEKEVLPYRNTSHVGPGEPPPPDNSKWLRIARKGVYCDYFSNKNTWNIDWASWGAAYGYHTGLSQWRASLNFPACLNKFHRQTVQIPADQWEKKKFYHYGDIVKVGNKKQAIRRWCKVPHISVRATGAPDWENDKDYPSNKTAMHGGKMYIATQSIFKGDDAPDVNRKWTRAGYYTDKALWDVTSEKYTDNTTVPAGDVYLKNQEKPVEFNDTYISGPIGPRYNWTSGAAIPLYKPYHIASGRAANSGHRDADLKADVYYQSYIENFCDRYHASFCGQNPRFNLYGTTDEQQTFHLYNHHVWKCNLSGFEACLDEIGHYDWYLDVLHPPQTTSAGKQILATWRRLWKYTCGYPEVIYYSVEEKDEEGEKVMARHPLIWPQEKGPPPYQQYCYKAIDADPAYDYDFWREPGNVLKAFTRAVSQLTDNDRKLVERRHKSSKDYELSHHVLQDMYDVLMVYKYVKIEISVYGASTTYSPGPGNAYDSFEELNQYMREHPGGWGPGSFDVGWSAGAYGTIDYTDGSPKWPADAGFVGYPMWGSNLPHFYRNRTEFHIFSTKEFLDSWERKVPNLSAIIKYEGSLYFDDPPPTWYEEHIDLACGDTQIGALHRIFLSPYTPEVTGEGLICDSMQPATTSLVTITKRERLSDTQLVYYLEAIEGSCFGAFNQLGDLQPREAKTVHGWECPASQTEHTTVFDYTGMIWIDYVLTGAAFKLNPIQPLDCTPLN